MSWQNFLTFVGVVDSGLGLICVPNSITGASLAYTFAST
jgi:hypothetical protein